MFIQEQNNDTEVLDVALVLERPGDSGMLCVLLSDDTLIVFPGKQTSDGFISSMGVGYPLMLTADEVRAIYPGERQWNADALNRVIAQAVIREKQAMMN